MNLCSSRQRFASLILPITLLLSGCNFFGNSTLTSIAVTPETPSVAIGATQQMVATGTYNDGSTKNISSSATWTSADTDTATVSSTGLVTGVAAGTASVTAASGSISGATTVSVTYANLKSIEVTPTTASITSGETQQFVATATLEDGSTVVITTQLRALPQMRASPPCRVAAWQLVKALRPPRQPTSRRLRGASRVIPQS